MEGRDGGLVTDSGLFVGGRESGGRFPANNTLSPAAFRALFGRFRTTSRISASVEASGADGLTDRTASGPCKTFPHTFIGVFERRAKRVYQCGAGRPSSVMVFRENFAYESVEAPANCALRMREGVQEMSGGSSNVIFRAFQVVPC